MAKIGFIGAGNMAEAIIKGIIDAKVYKAKDIIISDIRPDRLDLFVINIKLHLSATIVNWQRRSISLF